MSSIKKPSNFSNVIPIPQLKPRVRWKRHSNYTFRYVSQIETKAILIPPATWPRSKNCERVLHYYNILISVGFWGFGVMAKAEEASAS